MDCKQISLKTRLLFFAVVAGLLAAGVFLFRSHRTDQATVRVLVLASASEMTGVERAVERFREVHDEYTLKLTPVSSEADFSDALGNGRGSADIAMLPAGHTFETVAKDYFVSPASLELSRLDLSAFPAPALESFSYDGEPRAVPIAWTPSGYFVSRRVTGTSSLPESYQGFLNLLERARKQNSRGLVLVGERQGQVVDLFLSLMANQPASGIATALLEDEAWFEQPQAAEAIEEFRSIYRQGLIHRSSFDYGPDDAFAVLNRDEAATVFAPADFGGRIAIDERRQYPLSRPPLQGPRRPIIVGRLVGAAITETGSNKASAKAFLTLLADHTMQEQMASGAGPTFYAPHTSARYPSEAARTAARLLSISERIFPAGLKWVEPSSRDEVDAKLTSIILGNE